MQFRRIFILATLWLGVWLNAEAAPLVLKSNEALNPTAYVQVLADPLSAFNIDDIRSPRLNSRFSPAPKGAKELNFGFTESTYWLKLSVQGMQSPPANWVLEIPYLNLDDIVLYTPDGQSIRAGLMAPTNPRLRSRFYTFPLGITSDPQTYYLQIKSSYAMTVPLKLMPEAVFFTFEQRYTLVQSLYFGGLIALAVYNLLIFMSLRDKNYLLYFLFTAAMGLAMFSGNGFSRVYLWPESPAWNQVSQSTLFAIAGFFSLRFAQRFLDTKSRTRYTHLSLSLCALAYLALAFLMPLAPIGALSLNALYIALFALTAPLCILLVIASIKAIKLGQQSAKYFLLSWSSLWIGAIVATLRAFDLIPSNVLTSYALQIGSVFEMLLLSLALANQIQGERLMREAAQREALAAKESTVRILRNSESRLENLVKERTAYLQVLLDNEKNVRAQYVRFGAMISHEFRNPLGIIETQLELLKRELKEGVNNFGKRYKTLFSATQRLTLLFERWLQSDRLNNMMEVLQSTSIQLNPWIDDLLKKYRNSQPNHKIAFQAKNPDATLLVDDQLMQTALLNLLDNACKYSPIGSRVSVDVLKGIDEIGIAVTDEGIGIDPGHHEAIFKEYFRVNENSPIRGIGLGLAFVSKIVALHQGRIQITSRIGEGTKMCIWLPAAIKSDADLH